MTPTLADAPVDTLQDIERQRQSSDPTGTRPIVNNYAARLRGALGRLNAALREAIVGEDIFALQSDGIETLALDDFDAPAPNFNVARDEAKIEGFMSWLRDLEGEGVVNVISEGENAFVKRAYTQGIRDANRQLELNGIDVPDEELEQVFNQPKHSQALAALYAKNFSDYEGITRDMNREIREELTQGFAKGENPTKIARRISDRVDKIGKTRATTLARTNIIEAYSDATLNRYENMGVTRVTVKAEWLTAGDQRVCPICQALEGNSWSTSFVREGTFEFEAPEGVPDRLSGSYPVKPPAHPRCRCALIPEVA